MDHLDQEMSDKIHKARRRKNAMLAAVIFAFVLLIYFLTMIKMG